MQRTNVRKIKLFMWVCMVHAIPASAWNLTCVKAPLRACVKCAARATRAHPYSMMGTTAALAAGALTLYLSRSNEIPQAQNQGILQKLWQFARTRARSLNRISSIRAISNYIQPPTLAQRVQEPLSGYQPANDTHLAVVPFFNDPNNLLEPPKQFQSPRDGATVTVQQVRASMQTGGETCGYECIKNSSGIVGLARGLSGHHLLTTGAAEELFGINPPGILRQSINQSRTKSALREFLITQLVPQNPDPLENETRNVILDYRNEYVNILRRFLDEQITSLEHTGQATLSAEMIRNYITQASITNRYAGNSERTQEQISSLYQTMVAYIRNPQNIARYITLGNPVNLTTQDLNAAILGLNTTQQDNAQIPTNGEDLEPEEMARLVQQERERQNSAIGLAMGEVPNITMPSTENPAPEPRNEAINPFSLNETIVNIQRSITERNLPQNRICAFSLRTAKQGTHNGGHWIEVVQESANGSRRYTLIDSTNHVQLFKGPGATFIQFLEGQCPRISPERMQQIVDHLTDRVTQCAMQLSQLENAVTTYQSTLGELNELPIELQQQIQRLLGPSNSSARQLPAPPAQQPPASSTSNAANGLATSQNA